MTEDEEVGKAKTSNPRTAIGIVGVLDIYGTTNILTSYYWTVGVAMLGAGVVTALIFLFEKSETRRIG